MAVKGVRSSWFMRDRKSRWRPCERRRDAASILDLMTSPDLLRNAKAEFDVESKKTPYFSLLPADAKPDVDTNHAEMEKHRPALRRLYLNKTPRFN